MERTRSRQLGRVRWNPWMVALSTALVLAAIPAAAMAPAGLVAALVLALCVSTRTGGARGPQPAEVEASREGLVLDGRSIPRAEIRQATVLPPSRGAPARVRVLRRGIRPAIDLVSRDRLLR